MKINVPPIDTPLVGDVKIKTRFAWWPKRIGNTKIWLEYYQELWEYKNFYYSEFRTIYVGKWPILLYPGDYPKWVKISEKIL